LEKQTILKDADVTKALALYDGILGFTETGLLFPAICFYSNKNGCSELTASVFPLLNYFYFERNILKTE
jgi:hypothetical protein